jgi:plastocyanin
MRRLVALPLILTTAPGSYEYTCGLHQQMKGSINVK